MENKKLLVVGGILILAVLGYLAVTNNAKKNKSASDEAKAKADAAEKKRQQDLALMNDPERKKLYDDIYLALIKFLTDKINANYDRMKASKDTEESLAQLENFREGELIGVNSTAVNIYNQNVATLNKLSIDDLKFYLMALTEPLKIQNDPFLFKQATDFSKKYPELNME